MYPWRLHSSAVATQKQYYTHYSPSPNTDIATLTLQFAPVGVTLALDDVMDMGGGEGGAAEVPQLLYAFRFANLLTVFSSLQFLSSPGSIEFSNVEVVAIESSSFR